MPNPAPLPKAAKGLPAAVASGRRARGLRLTSSTSVMKQNGGKGGDQCANTAEARGARAMRFAAWGEQEHGKQGDLQCQLLARRCRHWPLLPATQGRPGRGRAAAFATGALEHSGVPSRFGRKWPGAPLVSQPRLSHRDAASPAADRPRWRQSCGAGHRGRSHRHLCTDRRAGASHEGKMVTQSIWLGFCAQVPMQTPTGCPTSAWHACCRVLHLCTEP